MPTAPRSKAATARHKTTLQILRRIHPRSERTDMTLSVTMKRDVLFAGALLANGSAQALPDDVARQYVAEGRAVLAAEYILFNSPQADLGTRYVAAVIPYTAITTGAVRGSSCLMTVIADGINSPTFSGIVAHGSDAGYVNTAGVVNTLWMWYDGLKYYYQWSQDAALSPVSLAATAVTMTGPTSGVNGIASTNFTVGANGPITGTVVVTPSDGGAGGTFTPTTKSISSGTPTGTFTYTPASTGAKTISVTNNGALSNPSNITYTVSASATAPGAPTIGTAVAGNASATVPFTAPASDGGSVITGYTATSSPGGFTGTLSQAGSGTITVSGLTNGTAYTFTVTATNAVGTGSASAASNSVSPAAGGSNAIVRLSTLAGTPIVLETGDGTSGWNYAGQSGSGAGTAVACNSNLSLPANTDGEFIVTLTNGGDATNSETISLSGANTAAAYNTAGSAYAAQTQAVYRTFGGGTLHTTSAVAPVAGDLMKIKRTGSSAGATATVTAEYFRSGSWTVFDTWTSQTSSITLYPQCSFGNLGKAFNLRANGMS
jgi:hypothetical protein